MTPPQALWDIVKSQINTAPFNPFFETIDFESDEDRRDRVRLARLAKDREASRQKKQPSGIVKFFRSMRICK